MNYHKTTDALLGVATGDALGVPFEFKSSGEMAKNPAKDMIGFGTWHQPAGTWSDDSSLTFCLAESLLTGYDLADMADKFIRWKYSNYWTARNELFDIGHTTSVAISRLKDIVFSKQYEALSQLKYEGNEQDNGNGSLMRILPLLFYIKGKNIAGQFETIWNVSALTHRHIRAAMSCLIYLKLAENILNGLNKHEAYMLMQKQVSAYWKTMNFAETERAHFTRIIPSDIRNVQQKELKSGGYVIESLETAIWCFLKEENYEKTVLAGVNLGDDTDTTAAIAGGLAGLYYGAETIPEYWRASIARYEDIIELGEKLHQKYN